METARQGGAVEAAVGSQRHAGMGFAAVPHARPGEVRVSHSTTVYGIDAPVPIQVSGGEYSINEGPFTAAAGTVAHRDRVRVRATAPLAHGSESAATLVVGTVAAEFRVRTFVPGEPINALKSYILSPFSDAEHVTAVLDSIWDARRTLAAGHP